MGEIFDLPANFCRGGICPPATAFSTIVPRVTPHSFSPPVFLQLRDQAYTPTLPSARMMRMISTLQSRRIRDLSVVCGLLRSNRPRVSESWTFSGGEKLVGSVYGRVKGEE